MSILKNKKPMLDIIPAVKREELGAPFVGVEDLITKILEEDLGVEARRDVEATLNSRELADFNDIGIQLVSSSKMSKPRPRPILDRYRAQNIRYDREIKRAIERIREPISPRVVRAVSSYKLVSPIVSMPVVSNNEAKARIVEEEIVSFYKNELVIKTAKPLNFASPTKKRRIRLWFIGFIVVGVSVSSFTLKNELLKDGSLAFNGLEEAGENFKNFNFSKAAVSFDKSYQDFSKISQTMSFMGAGLAGLFSELPGFDTLTAGGTDKIIAAKNLVEAGKLIAQSGQAMAEAVDSLSKTGLILNPNDKNNIKPLKLVNSIKDALLLSGKNLQKAKALISDIDGSILPEDKRQKFNDFKDKMPLLEEYLDHAVLYTHFLEGVIGIDEPKKYLLLFENSSELRPTGGFPGTYGVISFSSGGLADFFVNDVYNLDGQLKKNIIPPKQIQHITPNWGMRDSAWFIDFPTSAKKAMWFFEQEAGYGVDGVITINPDIVSAILGIVGPIELSSYDMTLTEDNFVESIQEEVEYGPNRTQPKQVVADFAPLFLEKLYSADSEKWMKIFNVLMTGLDEKDILFYFNEKYLEEFSIKKGYGGEVRETDTDYMMVTFSNIKGSKTDVVTDSSIDIESRIEDGRMIHKVILSRQHKGGDQEHGFYNRQNPAYVRMLLPDDSELISISGNDNPNFRPIMDYNTQSDFEYDNDLKKYESGFYFDKTLGVDKFEESNKKGIGFWMIIDPGTTKTVEFEYSVPLKTDYSFYFQKQPGLDWKDFKFSIQEPKDYNIVSSSSLLNRIGDLYMLDKELKEDLELTLSFDIDK